ncbi:hypothetical protein D1AOALGA4SA_8575 [Olavius algarvensis Delta 1 endosymbiont]|nr:hypothetical protein D1AOALGA4SA_8575 [Olavius algarvensis Delta 1 endosymbiont]
MVKTISIVLCLTIFAAGTALAVEISWMHVQHREYGNGKSLDRLGFGLIDAHGNYVTDNHNIKEVKLFDLEKNELKLAPLNFNSVDEIYGTYDSKNSQWLYSKIWQFDSWFNAEIIHPLNPGLYRLEVTSTDGKVTERTFAFNKRIELPIIDTSTLQIQSDNYGNLIWTWKLPLDLGQLALNHKTRARASIDIFKGNKNVGYFSIILPAHLAYVVIPADVALIINQRGDRFEFKVQIETKDKNNRTYSKPLIVREMLPIPNNKM